VVQAHIAGELRVQQAGPVVGNYGIHHSQRSRLRRSESIYQSSAHVQKTGSSLYSPEPALDRAAGPSCLLGPLSHSIDDFSAVYALQSCSEVLSIMIN
jgi:hypothetical protein